MGYYPETNYDFPNVSEYDGDLRELIAMYRTLVADYSMLTESQKHLNALYDELKKAQEKLNNVYNALKSDFDNYVKLNESEKAAISSRVDILDSDLRSTNSNIERIAANLAQQINAVKVYSDTQNEALEIRLANAIEQEAENLQNQINMLQFKLPDIFNPARGEKTDVQTVVNDFWYWLRYGGYTAQEFDDTELTCYELDGLNALAIEWDANGKILLSQGGH